MVKKDCCIEKNKKMKEVLQAVEVLRALGYNPTINYERRDIYFTSFGFDAFPECHKNVVRILLGDMLSEFYYGGINTQHIYYNNTKNNAQDEEAVVVMIKTKK